MLRQALIALQAGLVLGALWLGYSLVETVLSATTSPPIELRPVAALDRAATGLEGYQAISTRDLFRTTQEPEPPPPPPRAKVEKSKFAVRLIGTAASPGDTGESVAMLESQLSGAKMVVRVGDPLFGATVHAIDRRRVIVDNRGQLEEILPPEKPKPGAAKAGKKRRRLGALAAAARAKRARGRKTPPPPKPKVTEPEKAEPAAAALPGLLGQGGLLSRVRLVRVPDGANGSGAYSVTRLRKGGMAEKLGFQDGDVLVSLNGNPLSDAAKTLQQLRDADMSKPLEFEVDREGERLTIDVSPEDL